MDSCSKMDYSKIKGFVNDNVNFASANHIRLTRAELDHAEGELTVVPESLNPFGNVHGGCLATLADIVGGATVRSRGRHCVTMNCTLNYLRAATGSRIRGVGDMVRYGRTVAVCDITLLNEQDEKVAVGTFTYYIRDKEFEV